MTTGHDAPFRYEDCPQDERGHRHAVTRDGREVRLLCDDAPGAQPIIGLCGVTMKRWSADGSYYEDDAFSVLNLVGPAKRKRVVWINLYQDNQWAHASQKEADRHAGPDRIGPARCHEFDL